MKLKMTRAAGNVFSEIGFSSDQGEHLRVRSNLMMHLQMTISARNLTQAAAARNDLFSTDALIEMAGYLGIRVKLVLIPSRRKAGVT